MALTGDLSETPFPDVVELYLQHREPVALRIRTRDGVEGAFWIAGGEMIHAQLGSMTGIEAAHAAIHLEAGTFRVERHVIVPKRSISDSWTKILLESAWREDEASRVIEKQEAIAVNDTRKPTPLRASSTPARSPQLAPPPGLDPAEAPEAAPLAEEKKRSPIALIAAAAAVAAAIPAAVWLLHARSQAESGRAQPQVTSTSAVPPASVAQPPPELVFGMSSALTGPAKELGRAMKTGVEVAFAAANEAGGVNGHRLRLIALDDGYEPERTAFAMRELADRHHVFGFIGNVGTPTAAVAAPFAVERKMLFFGAFTGASLLRKDPPERYIFNYRASYVEETAGIVRWLVDSKRIHPVDIAVFAQEDAFGDAGFEGVVRAMRRYRRDPKKVLRVGFKRNTVEIGAALATLANYPNIRAVVMVAPYKPAARFIEKMRERSPDMIFSNVSFVGSTALAEELVGLGPKYAEGAIVTQVVPLPQSQASAVLRYQQLLQKYAPGEKPDFVSLEGYLAASLLIEGVRHAGPKPDTEKLIDALEHLQSVDLGTGAPLSFGMSEHQASHKIWGTVLDAKGQFSTFELD